MIHFRDISNSFYYQCIMSQMNLNTLFQDKIREDISMIMTYFKEASFKPPFAKGNDQYIEIIKSILNKIKILNLSILDYFDFKALRTQ